VTEGMKALVYEGPRRLQIRRLPVPQPAEGEVLIQVATAGICGSELSGYLGQSSIRIPPLVMGHEFAGTIAAIGSGVQGLRPGDRVAANPLVSCLRCRCCAKGQPQLCPERRLLGAHAPGAFAEYVVVPDRNVYLLRDGVGFEDGAFAEPLACGIHACRLLELQPTDSLFIAGGGPIGLLLLQAAKRFGVRHIVVSDLNESRLAVARELGAAAVKTTEELTYHRPKGGFDAVVDAVGVGATRVACLEQARPGGSVAFIGLHEATSALPVNDAIRSEIRMFGSFAYTPFDFETALQWIEEGSIRTASWTVQAPLEEGAECFERLIEGKGAAAKILLSISS